MANTARDLLIVGLRNAHGMENQAEELMERQAERSKDYPQVQARLRTHLEETRVQKQRLEDVLKSLNENTSTVKDIAMSFMGNMAAMAHAIAPDEILKNALANNAFEHYEIAAYKSLIALARQAGETRLLPILETSLKEEEQMAAWVDANLENVTLSYLAHRTRAAA